MCLPHILILVIFAESENIFMCLTGRRTEKEFKIVFLKHPLKILFI